MSDYYTIDSENPHGALVKLAGDYAYQASQYAKARRDVARAKLRREIVEAQQRDIARAALAADGGKVTEKAIATWVAQSDARCDAVSAEADAEHDARSIQGSLKALEIKRDALVQLCTARREEMRSLER